MHVSPAEVEQEHQLALLMLSPQQAAAINRLWRAAGSPRIDPESFEDNLQRLYATEADYRSTPGAGIA